jgi:hypothetical protein
VSRTSCLSTGCPYKSVMTSNRQICVEMWTVLTRSCGLRQFLSRGNVERFNTKWEPRIWFAIGPQSFVEYSAPQIELEAYLLSSKQHD